MIRLFRSIALVAILIFLLIFAVSYAGTSNQDFVVIMLTITTFLFGLFAAFTVSDRHNRIDKIRDNDSEERAALIFIYETSKVFGEQTQDKVVKTIDSYLIKTLDLQIWDYHKTENEYKQILKIFVSLKAREPAQKVALEVSLVKLADIIVARDKTIGAIQDRLDIFEWGVLLSFSTIIIVSNLVINTGSVLSIVITTALNFSIIALLLFLNKLDNLSWKEEKRIFEPYQRTFESIGKLRYYPEPLIRQKRVQKHIGKSYRLAVFSKPYPNIDEKEVKIITP